MDTLTIQSIEALKENGIIDTIFYEKNKFGETEVGYNYKNSFAYHWFSEYVWMDGTKTLEFKQSYSIATGVRKKGIRQGCKVEYSLRSKIEKLI